MRLTILLVLFVCVQAFPQTVAGRWAGQRGAVSLALELGADGQYALQGGSEQTRGRYTFAGGHLTLQDGQGQHDYEAQLNGDTLILSGGDLDAPLTLRRGGSTPEGGGDGQDQAWREQIRLGAPGAAGAPPDLPADPQPGRLFPGATVFQGGALYLWFSGSSVRQPQYPGGPMVDKTSQTRWYFLGNGRFFFISALYAGAGAQTLTAWGRYSVANEVVRAETDKGEVYSLPLRAGRRNLVFGNNVYSEVRWENASIGR